MRRTALSLAALLLLACAGYTGFWFYTAHRLAAGVGPWAEARQAEGYTVSWDQLAVGGFPAAFRLRLGNAVFAGTKPLPFDLEGATLLAEARPWDLRHWHVTAPRGARAALVGESDSFTAQSVEGEVALAESGTDIAVTARDIAGNGAASGLHAATAEAQVTLPEHPPANHREAGIAAAVRLAHLVLPWRAPPFGSDIEMLNLAATLKGALPQGRLREALAGWRDDGGTIELTQSSVKWGALAVSANGTLALDDTLQPIGALTATIEDQNAIVDAAVASGALAAKDAHLVKIFLGLMAKPGPDGKKQLTLPVSLQNDRVYLGPAQIAALPHFSWE